MLITFNQFKTALGAVKKYIDNKLSRVVTSVNGQSGDIIVEDDNSFIITLDVEQITDRIFNTRSIDKTAKEIYEARSNEKNIVLKLLYGNEEYYVSYLYPKINVCYRYGDDRECLLQFDDETLYLKIYIGYALEGGQWGLTVDYVLLEPFLELYQDSNNQNDYYIYDIDTFQDFISLGIYGKAQLFLDDDFGSDCQCWVSFFTPIDAPCVIEILFIHTKYGLSKLIATGESLGDPVVLHMEYSINGNTLQNYATKDYVDNAIANSLGGTVTVSDNNAGTVTMSIDSH